MKKEDENLKPNEDRANWYVWAAIAFAFVIGLVYLFQQRLKSLRSRKKLKSEIAEEYSISQRILLRWIDIFCSESYIKNYAKKNVKKIPQYDIYKTFGRPVRGEVFTKGRLAEELFIHRNTLANRLERIADFEKNTGMTYEQYCSLRTLPPKQYKSLIKLHNDSYPNIPGIPE